jgi:hypothetical protein
LNDVNELFLDEVHEGHVCSQSKRGG